MHLCRTYSQANGQDTKDARAEIGHKNVYLVGGWPLIQVEKLCGSEMLEISSVLILLSSSEPQQ